VSASALLVEPTYRTGPDYVRTYGDEVADLAALADFAPDPEQRLGLDLIFAVDGRDRAAAFEFAVVCSRQNLKTGLFKQAVLGWLFITDQRLIIWSAHEFRTAQEAFRDMEQLIGGCPSLSRLVKRVHRASGSEGIELVTGQRLMFKARTKAGGRGLTGDKVVLDEAFALQPEHMGALLPTLSVVPDPQVLYGSSAGLATSEVLRGIRDRGRPGTSPRLAYLEWCAPENSCADDRCTHDVGVEGCALDDPALIQMANPLLGRTRSNGTGLTLEYVRAERQALPPLEFARERLGWWDEPDGAEAAFGPGRWEACAGTGRPEDLRPQALAVAVSYELTHGAVGAAAFDRDGVAHVKPLQHGRGTGWLVDAARREQDRHGVDVVVDGRGPAALLIPDLRDAGIRLKVTDTNEVLDACAGIFDLVQERMLRHESYPELESAVSAAVKRTVGDRWAWGRKVSTADISALEAVTLATWWADRARVPAIY